VASSKAGTGIGVTTSGVRTAAGSGTAGDGTATAQILSIYDDLEDKLQTYLRGPAPGC
jgi:hypothetical protein